MEQRWDESLNDTPWRLRWSQCLHRKNPSQPRQLAVEKGRTSLI